MQSRYFKLRNGCEPDAICEMITLCTTMKLDNTAKNSGEHIFSLAIIFSDVQSIISKVNTC